MKMPKGFTVLRKLRTMTIFSSMCMLLVSLASANDILPTDDVDKKVQIQMNSSDDLEKTGKDLRKALDEKYENLNSSGSLKTVGNGRNVITDVIVKYIPIGTSFDHAEAILKSAGFQIGSRGRHPVFPNAYCVWAKIDNYVSIPMGRISIGVFLSPVSGNDWTSVQEIVAEIAVQVS